MKKEEKGLPFVTIIMPIRNEEDYIERSLLSVFSQDYPHNSMEVIIADGMSTDGTRNIIDELKNHVDIPVTVVDNPRQIVPTGMNIATKLAHGDVIIRVDGHCEIMSNYVTQCVKLLKSEDIDVVGGIIHTVSSTPMSNAIAIAMSSAFGVGGSAFRTVKNKPQFVDTVPFPAYTRHAIEKAGLYDEEQVRNQDDEYNYRLRKLGFKILLSPNIQSLYYSRSSLTSLWNQYFQYGYWKVRVMQKHPAQMRLRQFVPAAFFLSLIGSLFGAVFSRVGVLIFASIVCTYSIVNFGTSFWLSKKNGWALLLRLPVIFVILHFGYGLGFLKGLITFRKFFLRGNVGLGNANRI